MSSPLAEVVVWGTFTDEQDPTHDHTWHDAKIPADALGCFDSEAAYISEYLKAHEIEPVLWGSPVIVVADPTGTYERGCSTRSEFNGEDDPSHQLHDPNTDYHANCEHGI